jgi:putative IMPACT (imprinted ancient) family translation regulator
VLKSRALVDVVVVVARYFGGVLLGAGGLTRAYTQGCAIAVAAPARWKCALAGII